MRYDFSLVFVPFMRLLELFMVLWRNWLKLGVLVEVKRCCCWFYCGFSWLL